MISKQTEKTIDKVQVYIKAFTFLQEQAEFYFERYINETDTTKKRELRKVTDELEEAIRRLNEQQLR